MKFKNPNLKFKKGQSLLEILVSIAVGTIMIGGSVILIGISLRVYQNTRQHYDANTLLRQASEVIISLARDNWHNIYDLTPGIHYKLAKQGNAYAFQKGEEKIFDSQNLVSYWSFDEATSTIAYDNQSTNNGTLYNSPTWQAESNCVSGSCLSFNGSNNYINAGNPVITSNFTVEAWAQVATTSPRSIIGTRNPSDASFDFKFKDGNLIHGDIGNGTTWITTAADASFNYQLNTWYHIAYVVTPTGYTIYVNGNQVGSGSYAANTPVFSDANHTIAIGAYRITGGEYFSGLIDEPRIYNRALTADEIKTHYNAGLDKLGLVSYWALDENATTTAYDSQSTNNGTLYNSPTWQAESNCVSGSCLSFNGSTNYVQVGDADSLDVTTVFTYEVWVKFNSLSIAPDIFSKGGTSGYEPFRMSFGSTNINLQLADNSTHRVFPTYNINWTLGKWYYIVTTFENGTVKFYIDGDLKSTVSSGITSIYASTGSLCIGARYSGANQLNGLIDETRIYNRALSAEEIAQRYQASYTKYFVTNKISRTSGNIDTTYTSANDDPSTLKINSVVKYGRGLVSQQTGGIADVRFYLTRSYNNQVFHQTDWSGGGGQTGPISNPGNKFDTADSNINYASTTGSIYMTTATTTQASLTSSILDTGVSGGAGFNSLLWQGSLGTGGTVKFQIAFSNSSSGPWTDYYGPTSTSDYYQPNPTVSIAFPTTGSASPQNYRYIRYKVYLSTTGTSPQVNDIIINWAP